ncbi:MAG: FAD-binding protein [SAR202 cluster bacterium]|nr:FAD-dependent oxidoreductase [SAR202 cluster bacterium]MQG70123.1 FAD-binding protein [SAR202 cluster bacterium]HAL49541.1 thioredoxin-disulfide reductase [Dehalococcoidia bacterium]|tara:strand:+ start:11075 stop:12010 length:936 start_codon:yes stop_codon:yes gene_type:complete
MPDDQFDVVIIGGGAAGLTAGIFASRHGMKTTLLERMMTGGQVINAEKIENYPGFPEGVSGFELGPKLQEQAMTNGLDFRLSEVTGLRSEGQYWSVETYDGELKAKAVIIAGGSTLRKLGVAGEEELHGAGVSYCATCDGGFFMDQVVAVVGGGDSALDEAITLTEYASKVIVFCRENHFSGQKLLQDRVLSNPKIEVRWSTSIDEIHGDGEVTSVNITDLPSGETSRVDLSGVFIYVGLEPNSDFLSELIELDAGGHVPTDLWMRTPLTGLFAAGDIRQSSAAQLVTAAGDGATAAIAAHRYVEGREWED